MKVLHLEVGRRQTRETLEPLDAHRVETGGGKGRICKKHLARKFPITEDERGKYLGYTESLSQKGEKSFKIHNTEKKYNVY